ncbi:type II secretion system major pseudopilin GspG [Myxococcota bacterium]|nr:type II secretion system major pseudopilin GspG [Myxococcota bacterium]
MTSLNYEQSPEVAAAPVLAKRKKKAKKRQRGLTLIEILVVVTILGIIAGVIGINVVNALDDAKRDTAKVQLKNIGDALELYKIKFSRYPSTAEGLGALEKPPEGKKPLMDKVPKDPWGADYLYVSPGQHSPGKFDLQSKGPDGVADTEDDVKSW